MKKIILSLSMFALLVACDNEITNNESNKTLSVNVDSNDLNASLRTNFGRALVKALAENLEAREFIKYEAKRMFDKDYDIVYALVKDKKLESGITFRELLSKYFQNEHELNQIEQAIPLLTIFVPELPEKSFSADIWDVANQIPKIGVAFQHTNDVLILDVNEKDFILESKYIPSYPVVVIKECERMIASNQQGYQNAKGSTIFQADGLTYKFLDNVFDNSFTTQQRVHWQNIRTATGNVTSSSIDQKNY